MNKGECKECKEITNILIILFMCGMKQVHSGTPSQSELEKFSDFLYIHYTHRMNSGFQFTSFFTFPLHSFTLLHMFINNLLCE